MCSANWTYSSCRASRSAFRNYGCGSERQAALFDEAEEARIVVVSILVEAPCKQVLTVVLHDLLLVRQVAIAGIEALRQEQQVSDAIAILRELARMRELIFVALRMIGPDVLDLEAILSATLCVLHIVRRHARSGFDEVSHPSQQPMNLTSVHAVEAKTWFLEKRLASHVEPLTQVSARSFVLLPRMSRMTMNMAYCMVE